MSALEPPIDGLLLRIVAEYREMPGLSLTPAQAARLWGLPSDVCSAVVDTLVREGVLRRTARNHLVLA
ncbi:MAG: hypothetical protein AB7I50_16050 [Vicinamibacterales bacterium]